MFAINSAPEVTVNKGLMVFRGSTGVINPARLTVADPDNDEADLLFSIVAGTMNGTLSMSSFTMADIRSGKVTYTHNGSMATEDEFTFEASDPGMLSTGEHPFTITISTDAASAEGTWLLYD